MYFTIFLDVPQPPPYPSIWLSLPCVDFHWGSRAVAVSGRWSSIYWIKTFFMIFDMKKMCGTSFSETALWCCSLKHCHFCIGIIGRTILPAFLIPLVKMLYLVLGTTPQDRILIAQKLTELLKLIHCEIGCGSLHRCSHECTVGVWTLWPFGWQISK
jgi:hypothetical protein